MSKRENRQKATDVFKETNFLFGEKVSFDKAFHEIEDVLVEVEEKGRGVRSEELSLYNKDHIGEYINCSNPLCYNGGFSIGSILRNMIRQKQTTFSASQDCKGYEGSPKGKRKYRDCLNTFNVKVTVVYKEN